MKTILHRELQIPFNPAAYFFIFLAANLLLTFGPFSTTFKMWILLAGWGLPFFFFLATQGFPSRGGTLHLWESFSSFSPWLWAGTVVFGVVLRFWGLTDPTRWFYDDEALMGVLSVEKIHHWQWNWFDDFSESSTLPSFLSAPLFMLGDSPFFNLKFPTAVVASATVILGYSFSRRFFSKSFSLLVTALLALSYWPIWLGRFTHPGVFMPLWEGCVFYSLARFLKTNLPSSQKVWASCLGLVAGLGPLTYTSWVAVLPLVLLGLTWTFWKQRPSLLSWPSWFTLSFLFSLLPFLSHVLAEGYGKHILAASVWRNFPGWFGLGRIMVDYGVALFWGPATGICMPSTGGFLNPLLAACFGVGAAELWRFRREPLARWLAFSFLLSLLPGFLSVGRDSMRILPLLLPLLMTTAVGLQSVLSAVPKAGRVTFFLALLIFSTALDADRVFQIHQKWRDPGVEIPHDIRYECFNLLQKVSNERGPGFVFSEFIPESVDLSLTYSTYPFNANWNRRIRQDDVHWFAVFTESHYMPFLSEQFPSMAWNRLSVPGTPVVSSRYALGVCPLTEKDRPLMDRWNSFYHSWWAAILAVAQLPNVHPRSQVLHEWLELYPSVPTDAFLQSCFFEKLIFNYTWEKTFHPEDSSANWQNFSVAFQQSFAQSYQDAELCEKYGRLLAVEGRGKEAKDIFQKALKLSPGNPWLKQEMQQLGLSG